MQITAACGFVLIDVFPIDLLTAEVVEAYHVVFYSEGVEKVEYGLCHHWRSAEVVFAVFWSFVLLEVGVAHHWCYEAWGVFDACSISLWIRTVEGEMEMEVREVLLELQEVIEEWYLFECACSVEVVHWALTVFILDAVAFEHVHNLRTEWRHAGTAAYPDHLTTGAVLWTELSVRT